MKILSYKIGYRCKCGWEHITETDVSNYKHNHKLRPYCPKCNRGVNVSRYEKTEYIPDPPEVLKLKQEYSNKMLDKYENK